MTIARTLVADDDFLYRALFSASLEELGHEVLCVSNGKEALEELERARYDLLLLDLLMPELDGLSVLQKLHAQNTTATMPIIIVSATDELENLYQCLESGAFDFVSKPFEPAILAVRVRAALNQQKMKEATKLLTPLLTSQSLPSVQSELVKVLKLLSY